MSPVYRTLEQCPFDARAFERNAYAAVGSCDAHQRAQLGLAEFCTNAVGYLNPCIGAMTAVDYYVRAARARSSIAYFALGEIMEDQGPSALPRAQGQKRDTTARGREVRRRMASREASGRRDIGITKHGAREGGAGGGEGTSSLSYRTYTG